MYIKLTLQLGINATITVYCFNNNWGEPEQASHLLYCVVQSSVYIYLSIYLFILKATCSNVLFSALSGFPH